MLPASNETGSFGVPQIGFVVSKSVGNAVHRNKVKRRLRAAAAVELDAIPVGSTVVVRALPGAAAAPYDALRGDLHKTVGRVSARVAASSTGRPGDASAPVP
ncbi:hypothetical protein Slu03_11950 [Sediminihabitans luteus]|nr:hypothetical protein Slu03_11950 [Sediminihabitans luteus]